MEQLGATPGQSIELQVHLPPPPAAEPEEQQTHSTTNIAREPSVPHGRHGLPSSIIVQVNSGR